MTLKQRNFHGGRILANLLGSVRSIINGVAFLYKLTIAIGSFGEKAKNDVILHILWNSEAENFLVIFYGSHILCFIHKESGILKTENLCSKTSAKVWD